MYLYNKNQNVLKKKLPTSALRGDLNWNFKSSKSKNGLKKTENPTVSIVDIDWSA